MRLDTVRQKARELQGLVGLLDQQGFVQLGAPSIDTVLERHRGIRIIGSDPKHGALPPGRLAQLDMASRELLIRSSLLDDHGQEPLYRFVLAHELGHDLLHQGHAAQFSLDLDGNEERPRLELVLGYHKTTREAAEREANHFAAMYLLPVAELIAAVAPATDAFFRHPHVIHRLDREADWVKVVEDYRAEAIRRAATKLDAPEFAVELALQYWDALQTPRSDWRTGAGPRPS